jgi:hypothetical protein
MSADKDLDISMDTGIETYTVFDQKDISDER